MEEKQKEFLHIKNLINQKNKQLLNNEDFLVVDFNEDLRDKVKKFWSNSTPEEQVKMFVENNTAGVKMVTEALRNFGQMYMNAKQHPETLEPIDLALSQKTYYHSEDLPGFEGRLAMTQLFCNGRDSYGAYRMHNFFYLLPSHKFENEEETTDDVLAGDCL